MFCYQCEQTAKGTGCTVLGVCCKKPEVAALQDLLIYTLMGLSQVAVEGRKVGVTDPETNLFTVKAAFSTLTNVDFDPERFVSLIHEGARRRDELKQAVQDAGGNVDFSGDAASFIPKDTVDELVEQGAEVGLKSYPADSEDILSLKHTVLFGITPMRITPKSWARKMTGYMPLSMKGSPPFSATTSAWTIGSASPSNAVKQP